MVDVVPTFGISRTEVLVSFGKIFTTEHRKVSYELKMRCLFSAKAEHERSVSGAGHASHTAAFANKTIER